MAALIMVVLPVLHGQDIDSKISLSIHSKTLEHTLKEISRKSNIQFSYSPR